MGKELEYFRVEGAYGGDQEWFLDPMMRIGGCAAVTACDSCIYFDLYKGTNLYPYKKEQVTKKEYCRFGMQMKPYLRPRWSGIDTLEIYIEGFQKYLTDQGCTAIQMLPFSGSHSISEAKEVVKKQIDHGFPIPCLVLHHKSHAFKDYEWHWFLLTGYADSQEEDQVKIVTYGGRTWLNFPELWDTGYARKGGLILYR